MNIGVSIVFTVRFYGIMTNSFIVLRHSLKKIRRHVRNGAMICRPSDPH